ncbi:MAG: hypothetical protein ABIQ95_03080 [Bdellovibrionia bacterium]
MIHFFSMLLILLCSSSALAARAGTVDVEGTELYQFADKKSVVLIKLHKGTRLTASNVATLGFHKVRLQSTLVGWVSEKALVLQPVIFSTGPLNSEKAPSGVVESPELPPPTAP